MKILLGEKEFEAKLSSMAVEAIEEHYDKSIDEIFKAGMRAKDYVFMLWSATIDAPDLDTFKKMLSEQYTYSQNIKMFNELLGVDPNEQRAEDTKSE